MSLGSMSQRNRHHRWTVLACAAGMLLCVVVCHPAQADEPVLELAPEVMQQAAGSVFPQVSDNTELSKQRIDGPEGKPVESVLVIKQGDRRDTRVATAPVSVVHGVRYDVEVWVRRESLAHHRVSMEFSPTPGPRDGLEKAGLRFVDKQQGRWLRYRGWFVVHDEKVDHVRVHLLTRDRVHVAGLRLVPHHPEVLAQGLTDRVLDHLRQTLDAAAEHTPADLLARAGKLKKTTDRLHEKDIEPSARLGVLREVARDAEAFESAYWQWRMRRLFDAGGEAGP